MNKKFLSVMLLATFFLGSTSLFIACSDDDTVYDDTSVTSQISSLTSQLATLQSALTEAQNAASAAQSTADDALANAASAASAAASAADDAAAANNAALAANQAAEAASALAESAAATAKAEAIAEAIEQTKELIAASEEATDEQIQALALLIEGIDSDLNELSGALNGVSEEVKANAAAIVALQEQMTAVEKYKEDIESLSKTIAGIESDLAAVSNRVDGIELDLKGLSSDVTNLTETVTDIQASLLALTGNVNDLSSTLNGLLGDFSNLSGTVSNLSDYVDNLSSTLTSLSGTVSDLSSTVDGKCTMDEVKDYIAQVLSGDTQVVYTKDEVDELLAGIAGQISKINDALLILQTYKITSLVFIPELYVNGIEATRFAYASGVAWGEKVFAETTGTTSEGYAYVIPEKTVGDFYMVTKLEESVWYNLAPATKVSYHYNPSSAVLSDVTFGFDVRNVEAISRASDPTWSADIESWTNSKGILDVYYKISSTSETVNFADGLCDPKDGEDGEVSVMSLKATLANDTTVNSDYAAIVPAKRKIDYIAFTTASKCTADKTNATYDSCKDKYDLYQYAQDAAECAPSIECVYNNGALDLASLLCVHYTQADYGDFGNNPGYCEGIMDLDDLKSWGLSLEFASIDFQVGANKTDQSAYCFVTEDGKFTPAYIPTNGTVEDKTAIEENSTLGKSSIGRTPLVVVKLVDGNGSVVAFGYVRIKITEAATTTPEDDEIEVEKDVIAYDCGTTSVSVLWDNISANLYQYKNVSAEYFRNHYTTDGYTYIKNAKGKFVQSDDYGTVSQSGDFSGDNTTTVLKVTVNADQKFNIVEDTNNRTQTIYIKYSYGSDVVYVGFSITVAELPSVTFTERIGRLWVDETDGELNDGDETKWNVPAPGTPGKTVLDYTLTLDDLFFDQKVVATLGGEYKDKYNASEVNYTYSFATTENQDKIGSYSLYVNAAGNSLYANKSMGANYLVASINDSATGEIEYAKTDVAKEILNLYAHDYGTLAYAKVKLNATYGTCKRELEGRTFKVDFLRPIDIVAGEDAIFEDATATGDTVSLASLISIKDWRDKTVYSKKYPNGYSDNGVNLYTYYEFATIEVDLANAKYNGSEDRLASAANVQLSLVDKNVNSLSGTQTITSASALSDIYIRQYNTSSVTSDYTLQIPIKLTYAWGTVEYTIDAKVKRTMAN